MAAGTTWSRRRGSSAGFPQSCSKAEQADFETLVTKGIVPEVISIAHVLENLVETVVFNRSGSPPEF
jgi:hypothetical protein